MQMEAELGPNKTIMILDGMRQDEKGLSPISDVLTDVLKQYGAQVHVFSPRNLKLAHCIGCFGCWLETPGFCRFKESAYKEIFKAWMQSELVILVTPVTFGGYSSPVKQIVERIVPALLPYMGLYHGEFHHRPRYSKYPRLIGIGLQDKPNAAEADIFKLLVGRHAIDMHAPSYAAEVINSNDNINNLRKTFLSLLTRNDALRAGNSIKKLLQPVEGMNAKSELNGEQHALLIVGSPKTRSNSTSGVLGNYILDRMKEQKWLTESLTLKTELETPEGEAALLSAVDRADLLVLAFPLYVDALPYLLTRALEIIAGHRRNTSQRRPLRLFAISNNGFPESYQNNVALAICRNFAISTDMIWMGALAMGAGESIISGAPLTQKSELGFPLIKIHTALKTSADALARGQVVPVEAMRSLAGVPIPFTPFFIWRMMFANGSTAFWNNRAAKNGISKQQILAKPLESDAVS
jgi:multimeric flavodoxin WrbA